MSDEVVFGEDIVGNIRVVPGAPTGMLTWLVKNKIVKSVRHAELFLLGIVAVATIVAIFFFAQFFKGSAARPPVPSITGAPANPASK